jgi:hypothetical protein
MIGAAAFWEKWKAVAHGEENVRRSFWRRLLGALISGIAEIATALSSRQFGREEEKE